MPASSSAGSTPPLGRVEGGRDGYRHGMPNAADRPDPAVEATAQDLSKLETAYRGPDTDPALLDELVTDVAQLDEGDASQVEARVEELDTD